MILERLRIQDFRNISHAALTFEAGFNVLVGRNGQGKTNLLEALGLLASGRSFRRAPFGAMRRHDQPGFHLKADIVSRTLHHELAFTVLGRKPAATLNGKAITAVSAMGRTLAAVVLTPDAPAIVRGTPGERRDYLDWVIFCHDRSHARVMRAYHAALKARNHLLRTRCQDIRQFEAWEERLAVLGAHITWKRRGMVSRIGERLCPFLEGMGLDPGAYLWRLTCALDRFPEATADTTDTGVLTTHYRTLLTQSRPVDQRTGSTSVGPHRADPLFLKGGQPLARFGSRGQQKRFLLALKLVEADLLRERLGEPPLLLLDDPTAEMDQEGIGRLMTLLSAGAHQVFLATCTSEAILQALVRPTTVFRVEEGAFQPEAT